MVTDVETIWFWLEDDHRSGRGTAPITSIRDFVRRARWAANAAHHAHALLHAGCGAPILPHWSLGFPDVAVLDWSASRLLLRGAWWAS